MRILIINDYWKPIVDNVNYGGTEKCVVTLSQILTDLGHKVFISSSSDSSDFYTINEDKIDIVKWIEPSKQYKVDNNLGRMNSKSNIIPSIIEQIKENSIDYVLMNQTNQNVIRTIADYCFKKGIKHSVHIHSDVYNWGLSGLSIIEQLEEITKRGTNTVAVSRYHRERLTRNKELPPIRNVMKHFFIDKFVLDKSKDQNLVVSASRIDKSKLNHLLLENLPDNFNAVLMGNISRLNDKDIYYYENKILPHLNKRNINFMGVVPSRIVLNEMEKAKYVYDGDYDSPAPLQAIEAISRGCYFVRPKLVKDGAHEFINDLGLGYRIITLDRFKSDIIPDIDLDTMNSENEIIFKEFGIDNLKNNLIKLLEG